MLKQTKKKKKVFPEHSDERVKQDPSGYQEKSLLGSQKWWLGEGGADWKGW